MPVFPRGETELISLTQMMADGLGKMAADFPAPPVPAEDLKAQVAEYNAVLSTLTDAEMTVQRQHAAKDQILARIEEGLRMDIQYAQLAARQDPAKLAGLGWGPRRAKTPIQPPGEVRNIRIGNQADNWLVLSWKPPVDGGLPAAYRIDRSEGKGPWEEAGASATTEKIMANQPRGVELSFRVIAVNKAGQGAPSGVVTAVL